MFDVRRYWSEVRAMEATLPEYVWLMGIDDPIRRSMAGGPVEVPASRAARFLCDQTHRLATEQEIAEYRAGQDAQKRRAREEDMERRGVSVVAMQQPTAEAEARRPRAKSE